MGVLQYYFSVLCAVYVLQVENFLMIAVVRTQGTTMRSKIGKAPTSPPRDARSWRLWAAVFLCAAILLNMQWATFPEFAASTRGNDWTSFETIGEDPL